MVQKNGPKNSPKNGPKNGPVHILPYAHITSTAVLLLDTIPLRNRLLIILYSKGMNVKIERALVNSICC